MRGKGQRGASLVEFAFVLPVLALLVFGVIDFGFAFNDYISLRQGVRDGARQAAVANFASAPSCTPVPSGAAAGNTLKLVCQTKSRVGLTDSNTRVMLEMPATNAIGNDITLCAQYPLRSVSGLFGPLLNNKVLKTKVTMRIEQVDATLVDAAEDSPSGGDWTWCS